MKPHSDARASAAQGVLWGDASDKVNRRLDWVVRLCGVWAGAIGALWLSLWLAGVAARWSAAGALIPKANMALAMTLGAASLLLLAHESASRARRWTGAALAAAIFLIGGLTLSEHVFGYDLGIDQILAAEQPGAAGTAAPNRIGPPGSLSLTLLGAALLAVAAGRRRWAPYLALAVCLVDMAPLVGYLYGITDLYNKNLTGIAWPTVTAMLALAMGLLASVREAGPALRLIQDDSGGLMLRRLLPAVALIPLVLGWLMVQGDHRGWFDAPTGTAWLVLGVSVFFSALLWRNAGSLSRSAAARKSAAEALRESDERLRFALESCRIGAWDINLVDHTSHRSLVHDRIFGYNELLPRWTLGDLLEHALPEYRAELETMVREAAAEQRGWTYQCRIRRADGEVRWIWFTGSYSKDRFGRPRLAGVVQDITERRQGEERLFETTQRLEALMESLPVGVSFSDDPACRRITGNATAQALFEVGPGDNLSASAPDPVAPGRQVRYFQEGREIGDAELPLQQAVKHGSAIPPMELEVRLPSGRTWFAEVSGAPLFDREGKVAGGVAVIADISERKRSEEALRDAERRYSALFRNRINAIAHCRTIAGENGEPIDYEIIEVNDAYELVTGIKRADIEGKLATEVFPGIRQFSYDYIGNYGRVALEGGELSFEVFFEHLQQWLSIYIYSPKRGEFVAIFTDVSGRRKTEEALRESEERLRLTLESTGVGTFVYHVTTRDSYWDAAAKAAWGLPVDAKITYPQLLERVHPEDRARVGATFEQALGDDLPHSVEYRVVWPDGSVHWILGRSRTWLEGEGEQRRAVRVVGVHQDITERKQAEETLRQSEERLRLAQEAAGIGTFELNVQTGENTWGPRLEQLYGLPIGSFGRTQAAWENLVHPEDVAGALESVRHAFETCEPCEAEFRVVWPDGSVHWLAGRWQAFKDASGLPLRLTGVNLDITPRKQTEERLRQSQKLESLGLLAGGVAHDFNNLLVGVIGNASLAHEMLPPDHPATELIGTVVRTGEQAAHLTRQMLAYSGKGRFLLEPLQISVLARDIIELVRPSIPKKIAVHLELAEDLPSIEADRGQVQQILMNLAINAGEAIGSHDGLITVKARTQVVDGAYLRRHPEAADLQIGQYVALEVCDTGCGMDGAVKARIFDPFFSTKFTGRGLGLAAVAGIVRGHKGAIVVTSAPGKGSTFTVLFPPAAQQAGHTRDVSPGAVAQGSGVVLIVDDEQLVRDVAKIGLERRGYTVLVADGGLAAIDFLKRYPGVIDLAVLDLSMPGMSGEETLPELRKIRPGLRVVVSSGYSESEAMTMFRGQRVSGFVQKPYTSALLAEKVKGALG